MKELLLPVSSPQTRERPGMRARPAFGYPLFSVLYLLLAIPLPAF